MNTKFIQFLFKRIETKLDDIGEGIEDYSKVEDVEAYISTLKEIISEVLKP